MKAIVPSSSENTRAAIVNQLVLPALDAGSCSVLNQRCGYQQLAKACKFCAVESWWAGYKDKSPANQKEMRMMEDFWLKKFL